MSRYEQISKDTYDLVNSLEPVQLVASALLKDTVTMNYLAQLKLRNNSEFNVQKVAVVIVPYDEEENKVGNEISYIYDNLEISPNEEFGSNEAIPFSDINSMSSFQATVKEVVFEEGLEWTIGQTIDDVKSEKNNAILKVIEASISRRDFKKAIDKVDDIFDSNAKKEEIRNDIYRQCLEAAEKTISANDSVANTEKILGVIPDEYVGKKELLARIKEKRQKKKRVITIVSAAIIAVFLCVLIGNSIHKNLMYMNSILPEKVTWDDTYKHVERKLGSSAEKHPKLRYLRKNDIKHLGYHGRVQFSFNKNTDLLSEATVYLDETQDTVEKVLTKKYGEPKAQSDFGSFVLITWVYKDTEITLSDLGTYSCYVKYSKVN